MKIFICEDNVIFRNKTKEVCEEYFKERNLVGEVIAVASAEEFLNEEKDGDILLLDIELEGLSGIELKNFLESRGIDIKIIFLTNYEEYMRDAFGINVCGFLNKPVDKEILFLELDKIYNVEDEWHLFETGFNNNPFVPIKDIVYIKKCENYLLLKTRKENIIAKGTIKESFKIIEKHGFGKANQSYIVNYNDIVYKNSELIINENEIIKISRRESKNFKMKYYDYIKNFLK